MSRHHVAERLKWQQGVGATDIAEVGVVRDAEASFSQGAKCSGNTRAIRY